MVPLAAFTVAVPSVGGFTMAMVTPGPKMIGAFATVSFASTLMTWGVGQSLMLGSGEQSSLIVTASFAATGLAATTAVTLFEVTSRSFSPPAPEATTTLFGGASTETRSWPVAGSMVPYPPTVSTGGKAWSLELAFTDSLPVFGSKSDSAMKT